MKSAVQARVVLLIKPRLHSTNTLYSLLLNYKLEAAGESWPNFLRTVIRKWGYCTVNSEIIAVYCDGSLMKTSIFLFRTYDNIVSRKPVERDILTYLLTYLFTYLLTYLLTYCMKQSLS